MKQTLRTLFDSHKDELSKKLEDLSLPKDASLVQRTVTDYLNGLFDSDGEFRLHLTQSEDYMLQAAMSLLNAQQAMVKEFSSIKAPQQDGNAPKKEQNTKSSNNSETSGLKKDLFPHTIGATAVGGAVGGLILGTWGAVFGSIAGTAIILYYATQEKSSPTVIHSNNNSNSSDSVKPFVKKLDAERFIGIVSNICDSIDSLIETFRSQIRRVVDKYENQPKPTLESNFKIMLEGIQSLLGYERTHTPDEEKYTSKLQQRIEDVAELLDNYNLQVVNYSEENSDWFDFIESPNTKETRMVYPAIVKDGNVVLKGKAFIKQ